VYDVPLLRVPFEDWYCPNCGLSERVEALPPGSSRFHTCPRLHMLTAPLVRANVYAKVEAEERADYLNGEIQETGDDGRPYMAVRTTRDDGDDLLVNAAVAQGRLGDYR
jgi:hypothetical protein